MNALSSTQLEAFFTVAQTKSFTKAAERLHITQSALSQRILNLEETLETTLFIRDRAGLQLTEVAQKLVRYCQAKNDLESDFLSSVKAAEQISGLVRIGGFSSVMRSVIIPALAPLFREHPGLQLQVVTKEMSELLSVLKTGEVDFIVTSQKHERDEFESVLLGHEQNVLVEAKDHKGTEIYLDHDSSDDMTLAYLRKAGIKTTQIRRRYLDDVYGLIDGVKCGLGKAVLPRHLIAREKDLRILHPKIFLQTEVHLAHFKQPYYSSLHRQVVMNLVERSQALREK